METGELIKFLRKQEGLSQRELADILGVKLSSVQKYESGAVSNLKMETIKKLCNVFCISPALLVFPEKIKDSSDIIKMRLNEEGIQKVLEYAKDLADSGNYTP